MMLMVHIPLMGARVPAPGLAVDASVLSMESILSQFGQEVNHGLLPHAARICLVGPAVDHDRLAVCLVDQDGLMRAGRLCQRLCTPLGKQGGLDLSVSLALDGVALHGASL